MNKHQCPEGYVQVTDIKTIQKLILQLMVQFHEFCEKYHLVYNMCGGTLLGAVRHKGFIPWDDDLDVCMPRDDYDRFIEISKFKGKTNFIVSSPRDRDYVYPFAKICMDETILYERGIKDKYCLGLYLDIFPVDGYPKEDQNLNTKLKEKLINIARKLRLSVGKLNQPPISSTWWKNIFFIFKPILMLWFGRKPPEYYVNQYLQITEKYSFDKSDEVLFWWAYYERNRISKDKFLDRVLYDFEGYKFWSVRDYDDWLTRIYGNYMTPPPLEKRRQYHGYELFVKKELLNPLK